MRALFIRIAAAVAVVLLAVNTFHVKPEPYWYVIDRTILTDCWELTLHHSEENQVRYICVSQGDFDRYLIGTKFVS